MKQKLTVLLVCLLAALLCVLPVVAEEPQTEEEKQEFYRQETAKLEETFRLEDIHEHGPVDMEAAQRDMDAARENVASYGCDPEHLIPYSRLFSKISTDLTFDQLYSSTGGYVAFEVDDDGNRISLSYFSRPREDNPSHMTLRKHWSDQALYDLICRYPDNKMIFLIDKPDRYLMVQTEEGEELIYYLPHPDEYQGEYRANANARAAGPLDADWQTFLNATVCRNQTDPVIRVSDQMGGGGTITDYLGQKPAPKVDWTAVLFISGGCAVVLAAAGGILWTVRRRKKNRGTF